MRRNGIRRYSPLPWFSGYSIFLCKKIIPHRCPLRVSFKQIVHIERFFDAIEQRYKSASVRNKEWTSFSNDRDSSCRLTRWKHSITKDDGIVNHNRFIRRISVKFIYLFFNERLLNTPA